MIPRQLDGGKTSSTYPSNPQTRENEIKPNFRMKLVEIGREAEEHELGALSLPWGSEKKGNSQQVPIARCPLDAGSSLFFFSMCAMKIHGKWCEGQWG